MPVVHPFATGRLSRWEVVSKFLTSVIERGDAWFAPMEDIAAHVESVIASGQYVPRDVAMPQYTSSVTAKI